jgi:hypothetical protein
MSTHFACHFRLQLTMKQIHYDGFVAKNMVLPRLNNKQCQTFLKVGRWYEVKNYKNRNSENSFYIVVSASWCEIPTYLKICSQQIQYIAGIIIPLFKCNCKTAKGFVMSVSIRMVQLSSHQTYFHEIWYLRITLKICWEISSLSKIWQE